MASPYKMKGHALPGPNQKKSPMKEPLSALAIGLLSSAAGAAVSGGIGAISKSASNKKAEKAQKEQAAADARENAAASIGKKKIGSSTKLI